MSTISKGTATYARVNHFGVLVQSSMIPIRERNCDEKFSYAAVVVDNQRRPPIERFELDGELVAVIRTICTSSGWEHQYVVFHYNIDTFEVLINLIEHELGAVDVICCESSDGVIKIKKPVERKKKSFKQFLWLIFKRNNLPSTPDS